MVMMRCPYMPILTPVERITYRIALCEDEAEKRRLEAVRCVYESGLPPLDMAKRLAELRFGRVIAAGEASE